jgi:hypothetical protein
MKKRTIFLLLILILLLSFMLASCDDNKQNETDLSLKITESVENLLDTTYLQLESRISIDGKLSETILGVVDTNMKQAKVSVNDKTYYYFSKTRFEGSESGVAIIDYMTFPTLIDFMGATLLNFKFDKNNFSSITEYDGSIIAQFVGKGASYSFNTSIALSGGTLSFFFTDGKITKTVFSSSYKESSNTRTYTAVTTYSQATSIWEKVPKVLPSNSPKYAKYILTKLSALYPSQTFRLASTDYNTSFKVSGIKSEEKVISKVYVNTEANLHTMTITYTSPQLFVGIGGDVKSIDLCYDDDNVIKYMFVNTSKYLLS